MIPRIGPRNHSQYRRQSLPFDGTGWNLVVDLLGRARRWSTY